MLEIKCTNEAAFSSTISMAEKKVLKKIPFNDKNHPVDFRVSFIGFEFTYEAFLPQVLLEKASIHSILILKTSALL